MPTLSIVIPCHNEAEAIPEVLTTLEGVKNHLLQEKLVSAIQVIVVDDASTDGTPQLLREHPWIETVRLFSQSGYGSALKTGFAKASGDLIAFIDLDGTYDPNDLESLLREFARSDVDFIMGERFSVGQGMPMIRGVGNFFFTWLVCRLYKQPISDACTGYRIFRSKWVQDILDLPNDGLDFSLAITLWTIKNKIKYKEMPIRYHVRSGTSKLKIISDGTRFLRTIISSYFAQVNAPVKLP